METKTGEGKQTVAAKPMARLETFVNDEIAMHKELAGADVPDKIYTYTLMDVFSGEFMTFRFGTPRFLTQMEKQVTMATVHESSRHYSNYPANLLLLLKHENEDKATFDRMLRRARESINSALMHRVYGVYFVSSFDAKNVATVAFQDEDIPVRIEPLNPADFDAGAGDMVYAPVHRQECIEKMKENGRAAMAALRRNKKRKH